MSTSGVLLVLVAIAAVICGIAIALWIAFSDHQLANTLRARIRGKSAKAAKVLDDVSDRVDSAELTLESELADAKAELIKIKRERHIAELEYQEAKVVETEYAQKSENAGSIQRLDLVKEALARKNEAAQTAADVKPNLDSILAEEQRVIDAIAILEKRLAAVKREKRSLKSGARAADVTTRVDSIVAGIDTNGYQRDLEKARELLREKRAGAAAMKDMAEPVYQRQRMEDELAALGTSQISLEDEAAAIMNKFAPKSETESK